MGKIGVRIGVQIEVKIGLDLFLTIKTYLNHILLFKVIGIQRGQRPKAAGPFGGRPEAAHPISLNNRFKIGLK